MFKWYIVMAITIMGSVSASKTIDPVEAAKLKIEAISKIK
jgi:hypothetical protein